MKKKEKTQEDYDQFIYDMIEIENELTKDEEQLMYGEYEFKRLMSISHNLKTIMDEIVIQ